MCLVGGVLDGCGLTSGRTVGGYGGREGRMSDSLLVECGLLLLPCLLCLGMDRPEVVSLLCMAEWIRGNWCVLPKGLCGS